MNSSLQYSLNLTGSLSADKLGVTTTVKQQVQHIETALEAFKRSVDQQKKAQSELQIQIKKLDERTHKEFAEMLAEITSRAGQLTDIFKNQNDRQGKEFDYLDMQSNILTDQHTKLKEVSQQIGNRTNEMENRVGV